MEIIMFVKLKKKKKKIWKYYILDFGFYYDGFFLVVIWVFKVYNKVIK